MPNTPPQPAGAPCAGPPMPPGYKVIYQGAPLPAFYAAEMLRPYVGTHLWVKDSGGRVRCGRLASVPRVREDAREAPPVEFEDEKPLFLRGIVHIARYEAPE